MSKKLSRKDTLVVGSAAVSKKIQSLEGKPFEDDESEGEESDGYSSDDVCEDNKESDSPRQSSSSSSSSHRASSVDISDQVELAFNSVSFVTFMDTFNKLFIYIVGHWQGRMAIPRE